MDDKQNTRDNTRKKPVVIPPSQVAQNPNPIANENIPPTTEEQKTQNREPSQQVGSEITDGEDA